MLALALLRSSDPDNLSRASKKQLAQLYMKSGQYAQAGKLIEKLLGPGCQSFERLDLMNTKASLLRRMNKKDEAALLELEISRMR